MSQFYLASKWKMKHIPFTPYFLAQDPETKLWHIVEKEIDPHSEFIIEMGGCSATDHTEHYRYRLL